MFGFFKKNKDDNNVIPDKLISTMSGMYGVWDFKTYEFIDSYEAWEPDFCEDEDIIRQIEKETFVPIYLEADGCAKFRVKMDTPLDNREAKCAFVKSEEYLIKTSGKLIVSGIESISGRFDEEDGIEVNVEPGEYAVCIYLLDWEADPESIDENGEPTEDSVPDFLVSISSSVDSGKVYRKKLETFDHE